MAWIRVIPHDEVEDEELRTLYDRYSTPSYGVDHIIKIHSLNPKSMELHHDYYKHLMTGRSGLSRAQREMIAVVVSTANNCHYWMTHHGEGLFRLTKNRELVDALKRDYREADVTPMERLMLDYATKVTLEHCNCTKSDVDALREAGFEDVDILDVVQVTAYYNYVNRMACGLGVELESYWGE